MHGLGEHQVSSSFDRNAVWKKIKNRKAIFLDSMVWINMADGKPESKVLKDKLRKRVQAGDMFCPISPTLIWELHKQEYSKFRTGSLMEELSLNVSFPLTKDVFDWEVERFAKLIAKMEDDECSKKMVFLPAVGYIASTYNVSFPRGWSLEAIQEFQHRLSLKLNSLTLTDLLVLSGDKRILDFFKNMPPIPYQNEAKYMRSFAKGDRSKVWRHEEQSVFLNYILPAVRKLPIPLMLAFFSFSQSAQADKVGNKICALLPYLPSIRNHIEVMARAIEDPNRKDRPNDFFDLNMMPVPLAYADVFVSLDRWIRERFIKPGDFLTKNSCAFCGSYSELESWIDTN